MKKGYDRDVDVSQKGRKVESSTSGGPAGRKGTSAPSGVRKGKK